MQVDLIPLAAGALVLLASLISLRLGLSVAIIEILLGVLAGNFGGITAEPWMVYLATFGGIVLTFLAGAEVDLPLLQQKWKESLAIGGLSFLLPFLGGMAFCYYVAGWGVQASVLAGVGLSANSIAVVYSVLTETGLSKSKLGKQLMAATFVTNMGTALALSILFLTPTVEAAGFVLLSVALVGAAVVFSGLLFHDKRFANKVVEPEIKYLFVLLLALMALATWAGSQAILPAFVLGLLMAPYFADWRESKEVKTRLRTVAYAIITPFFFIGAGLRVSLEAVAQVWPLFVELFALKEITKFVGAYLPAKRYLPEGEVYTSLLMSTGLTFGTIAAVFGLAQGLIDQTQFSVLIAIEVASAVVPTVIAQRWFRPRHQEDIVHGG